MATTIRSSNQLYVDADFNMRTHKVNNVVAGTVGTDAVNLDQLTTAINNAVNGMGNAIHEPVADLAAAKAITTSDTIVNGVVTVGGRTDKMLMLIESLGLYHFDTESLAVSNDTTVIRPTDIVSDAGQGRWIKMSSVLTDHNLLSGLQGGTTNEYYHLTNAELTKLGGIEAGADVTDAGNVGPAINGTTAKTTLVDADTVTIINSVGSVLSKITWANFKLAIKTYTDTLYNMYVHPNHTGDVTSVADGATTITLDAVTNAKLANMATQTIKGRTTATTGDPEDLTAAQVRAILNVADGANNYSHPNHSGDVTSVGDGATTIAAKAVTLAKMADMATASFIGRNTAATGVPEVLSIATVKTMLGLTTSNQSQRTYRAIPTGAINGSNVTFTIAALVLSGTEEVHLNGLLLNAGAGNDYTISYGATTTITFLVAPSSAPFADVILVNYSV